MSHSGYRVFAADRLNRAAARRWGTSALASRLPVTCMPAPGWRLTQKRNTLRHQNFFAFTCAKLIVVACFVADLLPSSIGSYGVSPTLTQMERVGKLVAILWVLVQQALSHWMVLTIITWLTQREVEAATEKEQEIIRAEGAAHADNTSSVTTMVMDEEKQLDSGVARPIPLTSPTAPVTPRPRCTLPSLPASVDDYWRVHFLFFAVSVCRVAFETTRYAAAAAHRPISAYPDNYCIST